MSFQFEMTKIGGKIVVVSTVTIFFTVVFGQSATSS